MLFMKEDISEKKTEMRIIYILKLKNNGKIYMEDLHQKYLIN